MSYDVLTTKDGTIAGANNAWLDVQQPRLHDHIPRVIGRKKQQTKYLSTRLTITTRAVAVVQRIRTQLDIGGVRHRRQQQPQNELNLLLDPRRVYRVYHFRLNRRVMPLVPVAVPADQSNPSDSNSTIEVEY
jgi:hypothetical protein